MFSHNLVKNAFKITYPTKDKEHYTIPSNLFGIFATVLRPGVHGCIGNWDLNGMSRDKIIEEGFAVSNSAFWNDSRRSEFKIPIEKDPNAILEISFMKRPFYKIASDGTIIIDSKTVNFNNSKYGIIAEIVGVGRATFLPDVFPGANFSQIKPNIIQKAGLSGSEPEISFYAYECVLEKTQISTIFDCFDMVKTISKFVNTVDTNFIPFMVNTSGKIIYDDSEHVRNAATLWDYVYFSNLFGITIQRQKIHKYIDSHLEMNNQHARIYLYRTMKAIGYNKSDIHIEELYSNVENSKIIDREFELPQTLICLTAVAPRPHILLEQFGQLLRNVDTTKSLFLVNWVCVLFAELVDGCILRKNISEIWDILFQKVKMFVDAFNWDKTETNELAVALEALSALYLVQCKNDAHALLFYLFICVEQRKTNIGLYAFLNGECRIDITGHVLNGFSYICFSELG